MSTKTNRNVLIFATAALLISTNVYANDERRAGRWAKVLARIACESVERYDNCQFAGIERDKPARGITRTQYHLKVGAGEFDTITIHHVAAQKRRSRRNAVMLLPGTGLDVENVYLPGINSDQVAGDFSPLIHFAREGIDTWSVDYRGSDLPTGITDYGFMADWGLVTATADIQLALRFARLIRLFSGNGYRRIHIGGYSAGVSVAFSVASADAARHHGAKDVRGIVAVDDAFDTDPADNAGACADLEIYDSLIADGIFNDDLSFLILISEAAKNAPDEPTMFGPPGFTNLQFFNLVVVLPGSASNFHIFGGQFDDMGFPFPAFTDQNFAIDQGTLFEPALPVQFSRELAAVRCSTEPVSVLDGGLGNITVPVFHIGAAGGNANAIDYTLSQLGSSDITSGVVQVLDPGQEAFDYGHGDVFAATDAEVRIWQPIVDWLKTH